MKKFYALVITSGFCFVSMTTLHAQPSCLAPPSGLVAWWRGEGNATDSAGTNHGKLDAGLTFTNGMVGQGFFISGGGNDLVELPINVFPQPAEGTGNTPFSFEVWFKTAKWGVILGQQDAVPFTNSTGYVPALYVGTNGHLYASMFYDSEYATVPMLASPGTVNDGSFHHAAVTYDGVNESLYLDGVVVGSVPFTQDGYATEYHYQLGTGYTAGWVAATGLWSPFKGVIDEASLYNRALSAAEVAAIFSAGSAGKCYGTITVGAALRHRYSFGEAAGSRLVTDSVGGANGALRFASTNSPYTNGTPDSSAFNGAGLLSLSGTNGFVDLPDGIVSGLSNVTFEAWVIWRANSPGGWQRILDFGANDHGANAAGTGTNYLLLTPARGGANVVSFQETTVNPQGGQSDPKALMLDGTAALPLGTTAYVALTYDPIGGSCRLFVNGTLVSSMAGLSLNPLANFVDYNNWLGRSQWAIDPFFNGQFDEFRIWEGILSDQQISDHFAGGPNQQFVGPPRPTLSIARSGGNLFLSWPTNNTAGFQLQSNLSLTSANWIAVTNTVIVTNTNYRVTLPATSAAAFFRLKL